MHKSKKFNSGDIILLSLAHHIHDIYTSFLAPVQTLLIEKLAINHTLFGLLAVIQRLPNLLNPFVGILADRIRIRYMVIFAPAVTAIAMSLIGIAPTYTFLAILMFVSGISSSMFHVPTPVMIKHIAGNRTGRGMSFYMVGGELARTIGPLLIIGSIELWGFDGIFRLIPMGLAASVILFLRFRNLDLRKDFADRQKAKDYTASLREFMPLLLIIISITFARGLMKSCFTFYLPGYMEETGSSIWIAGISLSVVYLSGTAGTLLSGTISDYIGRKNTLLIFAIVSPLLMWLFILAGDKFTFPILILIGFFLLATTPVILAIIHDQKTKHLSFLNGLYMTSTFIVSSITTLIAGYLLDTLGNELTFKISGGIAFLAIPAVLLFKEKSKD